MTVEEFIETPHPFLAGMSEAHLAILAHFARKVRFSEGELIFREGEPANRFFLLEEGQIGLHTHSAGRSLKLQTLEAGDVLGWSWLFPPYFWHFDAWAEKDTTAFYFDAATLREQCELDKTLGYEVMRRVAEVLVHRLQGTRLKLVRAAKQESVSELSAGV